ncbi:exonuclease [Pseudoxanthomonas jiangsuensis]|uniref:lambda exonuclease family protein n=1 Tax=Pseudoxanthomonas jiangsuensis TaxID=619688 RepID=UPI001391049C|nr:lambda exonuclease family protein [Pseudoxanthomonas jiangsuensis]KAF1698323.1 exonuclease [Pseudoxanthomonas jiangsuensis]
MQQRSDDWFRARAGKLTASKFADVMNVLKDGSPGANRRQLVTLLAVERLTGECVETFQNDAMRRGTELEPAARAAYEAHTGELVEEVGFVQHATLPYVGVSPDGLLGDDGLVELKCPANMAKHLDALRSNDHAKEYRWQLQGQLWVTGRAWVDAVSFDPRFPPHLQLAICRVQRDEGAIAQLAAECEQANSEIESILHDLKKEAA